MGCSCAPSLLKLRQQVDFMWPGRDRASDGCCGDPAHASRKSDHNPTNGYAHALDIDEDVVAGMSGAPLWEFGIGLLSDKRVKYLIYEGRILYPPNIDRPYYGPNAHKHHLHVSIYTNFTYDTSPWPVPTPRKEPLMYKIWYVPGKPEQYLALYANGVAGYVTHIPSQRDAETFVKAGVVREAQNQDVIDAHLMLTSVGP